MSNPTALLLVTAEPGAKVTIDEFQDWYNNEHVPLRMDHLDSFHTGARYSACDAQKPSWIAFYDIASPSVFSHDSYTRLRANRSPREAALVSSLEILDRRTYEVVSDSGVPDANISTSWKPENPSHWVVTEGFGSSDEASENEAGEKWMQDARGAIDGARGWVRTRTFKLLEGGALRSGLGVGKGKEEQTVPRYLALHEFVESAWKDEIFKARQVKGTEFRIWNLYKAYPKEGIFAEGRKSSEN